MSSPSCSCLRHQDLRDLPEGRDVLRHRRGDGDRPGVEPALSPRAGEQLERAGTQVSLVVVWRLRPLRLRSRRHGDADGHQLPCHDRRDGGHVVAVRLCVLHLVHRRRGQAARQDHHLVQHVRHRGAHDLHAVDGHRSYHVVGQQFLAAGAWNDQNGPSPDTPCRGRRTSLAWRP